MGYRIDNKEIDLTGKRAPLIASGKNGDIYKYKNTALKVFDKDNVPMDKDTAKYLSSISTTRVLLPKKLVFYNNSFRGYTMKLISNKGTGRRIINLKKGDFLDNVYMLEDDISLLSSKNVLLAGVSPENTIFNGELYLSDPSQYSLLELKSGDELDELNKFQLHLLLTELILSDFRKTQYSQAQISRVRELLNLKDSYIDSSDYYDNLLEGNDSVKEIVKKIG